MEAWLGFNRCAASDRVSPVALRLDRILGRVADVEDLAAWLSRWGTRLHPDDFQHERRRALSQPSTGIIHRITETPAQLNLLQERPLVNARPLSDRVAHMHPDQGNH